MPLTTPVSQPRHELNIGGDYLLMVEGALPAMGWANPEAAGVPAQERIEAGLRTGPLAAWLIERADQGAADQLVISPRVGGRGGIGVANLIHRLDPDAFNGGYVWSPLWGDSRGKQNPYGNHAAVHNNAKRGELKGMWDVAVLLGDATDPAAADKENQQTYDPGLVYTNRPVTTMPDKPHILGQRQVHAVEKEALAKRGITIVTANVGHMAVDSASLIEQGELQRAGVHRFIHCEEKPVGAGSYVPRVYEYGGRFHFYGSYVGDDWDGSGSRRVARVLIPPLEA